MGIWKIAIEIVVLSMLLVACGNSADQSGEHKLKVVASTTIIGDVVKQVGGDAIDLSVLMPVGADPHTFEPRPQDVAAVSEAKLIFINGLGLEEALEPTLDANAAGRVIHLSDGVEVLTFADDHQDEHKDDEDQAHEEGDPHTWMDPTNVMIWVEHIQSALAEADPEHADAYRENANAYLGALEELDEWVSMETQKISLEKRQLISDHASFGYFAHRYGFEQAGLIVVSLSTNASPSAQELAELEDTIRDLGVPAVFVGKTVNPTLAEQVAKDTGAKVVQLYTGSLSEPGSEADTYLNFIRYNVQAIVNALK